MASNIYQELRHAAVCSGLSITTPNSYNQDFMHMFAGAGFSNGTFNERLLRWINDKLSTSYDNINAAMTAYAVSKGPINWNSLNTITV